MKTRIGLAAAVLAAALNVSATSVSAGSVRASDYVQDGLVAQWDGIENVAPGEHDDAARFWADISGNGHVFTNFIEGLSWADCNSLQMPSSGYEKAATTPTLGLPSCVSFEIVFRQTSSPNYAMPFCFGNFRGCLIAQNRKSIQFHNGTGSTWSSETEFALNQIHHAYASYQEGASTLSDYAEVDGQALTSGAATLGDQSNVGYNLGYKHNGALRTNRAFYGQIYAIRIYSRRLTAAERAWNRALDNKRFVDTEAEWNPPASVTPTVTVNGEGTVTPAVATAVGDDIELTATPSTGSAFGFWSGDVPAGVDATDPHLVLTATATTQNLTANFQKIVYVAEGGIDTNGGTSWEDAFATVSAALASCDDPYVQVGPGVFASAAAVTVNKPATIAGMVTDGEPRSVVKLTAKAGAAFVLTHPQARLTNLAITTAGANGHGVCLTANGLVDHCVITNCYAYQNNYQALPVASANKYDPGAGVLLYYDGRVRDCLIADCQSWCNSTRSYSGGGVLICGRGLVENCRILRCHLDRGSGGGVALMEGGTLRSSLVSGCYLATGDNGVGVSLDSGSVENCTIADNHQSTSTTALGLYASGGIVRNTIIWGNTNKAGAAPNTIGSGAVATYCTSEELLAGEGNCTVDPKFTDAAGGDYTIGLSACVDAGVAMPWHAGAKDLKGDDRVIGSGVDFGCYELDAGGLAVGIAATSDGCADQAQTTFTASLMGQSGGTVSYSWTITGSNGFHEEIEGEGDAYASITRNLSAGVYDAAVTVTCGGDSASDTAGGVIEVLSSNTYVALGGTGLPPYTAVNPGGDIQAAVASTAEGGTVHLASGFYTMPGSLSLIRGVRVRADAGRGSATVYAYPKSSDTSIVFINHAGAILDGVAVSGYSEDRKTRPTSSNGMAHGINIGAHGGIVTNCIVDGVSGETGGGGICLSAGLVTDSVIRGNLTTAGGATKCGGGVRIIGGVVSRCVISNNTAAATGGSNSGGGVYLDGGRLVDSIVLGNTSDQKAGGICNAGGQVVNCLVVRNKSKQDGSGVYQSGGSLLNVTIADNRTNTADVAGCLIAGGTMKNAIVWGNEGTVQLSAPQSVLDDASNFTDDPCFKNRATGDYRLKNASPCVDAGDDSAWTDIEAATDLTGAPRRRYRHVDCGCYECPLLGFTVIIR